MEPQTDLDYNTGAGSSIIGNDNTRDVDHNNISILVQQLKKVDEWIVKHNTFDVIVYSKDMPSADNQIIANKLLVSYLRVFRDELADKIEELK